jgi:ribosomal protein S18 acetylase RimI-like enzyme
VASPGSVHAMGVHVEVVERVSDELVEAFGRLVPQLSSSVAAPGAEVLGRIVAFPGNRLLVARDEDVIVGTLTLVLFPIPTGLRARIEDVVVDEAARGRGVGASLSLEALRLAAEAGARSVDLTSRPGREAANRLYQRLGFRLRESHVYRYAGPTERA